MHLPKMSSGRPLLIAGLFVSVSLALSAAAQDLVPGDLLVSRTVYQGTASTVTVGQNLPGGGTAIVDGTNLSVFGNESKDPSFGITSSIYIDQLNIASSLVDNTINVTQLAANQGMDLTTSFPSKSELALNVSTNGTAITFMGYIAPVNTLDVSNSNTPGHVDSTNPVTSSYQRAVGQISLNGSLSVTPVNAYSGNNGRAAILVNGTVDRYYMVGNAGNGSGTEPTNIVNNTGVQTTKPGGSAETTVVGAQSGSPGANGFQFGYSVTQNGYTADKSGKDDNFRGLTVFNNTLYVTKGSGSNGINTVYQVGATGSASDLATNASTTSFSILAGFNTALARTATTGPNPFGLFFANAHTLYVADEGSGATGSAAVADTYAGLEKWVNSSLDGSGTWTLAYTLTGGLNIGSNYTVSKTDGSASVTTQTTGLRNLAGFVNGNTVTLYSVTSTSGSSVTDSGADPNRLVTITDTLDSLTGAGETFTTLQQAAYGEALRGVALAPIPEPAASGAFAGLLVLGFAAWKRRRALAA